MAKTPYQNTIFTPPGRSGFFSRIFFYAYNRRLNFLKKGSDLAFMVRTLLFLGMLGGVVVFLIAATPVDPLLVYKDQGYELPSQIYARDHQNNPVLIAEFYRFNRQLISLSDSGMGGLDSKIARAFIASEDNNFKSHPGVDVGGILRAMRTNLLAGRIKEGASTITQQAARLRFLTTERSFVRKAREAVLALWLELRLTKEEIMELYMNEVPLGHGTLGVEAAARFYFNKSTSELRWGEAALLASLTTRPRSFSPIRNINNSRNKVRISLMKMVENGCLPVEEAESEYQWLEENYYRELNRSPNDTAFNQRLNSHPYVSEYVKYLLPREFRRRLYTGGLKIYTTIQVEHQRAAESQFISHLKKLTQEKKRTPFSNFERFDEEMTPAFLVSQPLFDLPEFAIQLSGNERDFQHSFINELRDELGLLSSLGGDDTSVAAINYHRQNDSNFLFENFPIEGSLVSIRPNSGEITALVGGSGFSSKNQLLRFVHSRRPPGSSFKPIVYAAGLEYTGRNSTEEELRGLTAATIIDDSPLQYINTDLSEYSPENYSLSYDGPLRLRRGLSLSKNMVAVRVYERLRPDRINPIAEQILQMDKEKNPRQLRRNATVALGTHDVTTLEMARSYALFASGGREVSPHVLLYITDSSEKVLVDYRKKYEGEGRQVLGPETAEIIVSMLGDAVETGTGKGARVYGRQVAGKTGTTNRYKDAWFVGFTPRLVTAIHIGYDRAYSGVGSGGSVAAPVWARYMGQALRRETPAIFEFPESRVTRVEICELSGKLPGHNCTHTYEELFWPGTEPTEICNDHGGYMERLNVPVEVSEDDALDDEF